MRLVLLCSMPLLLLGCGGGDAATELDKFCAEITKLETDEEFLALPPMDKAIEIGKRTSDATRAKSLESIWTTIADEPDSSPLDVLVREGEKLVPSWECPALDRLVAKKGPDEKDPASAKPVTAEPGTAASGSPSAASAAPASAAPASAAPVSAETGVAPESRPEKAAPAGPKGKRGSSIRIPDCIRRCIAADADSLGELGGAATLREECSRMCSGKK